jgi:hypothetical protein
VATKRKVLAAVAVVDTIVAAAVVAIVAAAAVDTTVIAEKAVVDIIAINFSTVSFNSEKRLLKMN